MKILFVDNSADLQQKWLDPLRAEGWGALRARSAQDADRMVLIHGESIEVVVVHESMVTWAEKQDFVFAVLTKNWGEKEILTHQNSNRSAFYYQPYGGNVRDLQNAIQSYRSGGPVSGAKQEATQWSATKTIALEDFTNVLTKPEVTKTNTEFSIKLEAPSVLFGGETTNAGLSTSDSDKTTVRQAPSLEIKLEPANAQASAPYEAPSDATRVSIEAPNADAPKGIEIHFDQSPAAPAKKSAEPAKKPDEPLPEVMEVKLDLEAPTRIFNADETRVSTQATATVAKPADSTVVLENTKLELTTGEEVSQQIDAMAEEEELLGELSINEEIIFKDVVGGNSPLTQSTPVASAAPSIPAPPVAAPTPTLAYSVPVPPPAMHTSSVLHPTPAAPAPMRAVEGDETLKNYLAMREQDVAVLTGQVRSSQERIAQLEMQLRVEKARSTELQHVVQKQEQQLKNYDQDKQVEIEVLYRQVEDLNQQLQERTNKAHTIEAKLRVTTEEVNKVKERVRVDIRRIRVREKELESQLEILKKDSAALLQARDEKILELKRKLDLLEFNMELIQEQYSKERQSSEDLRNRLKDAAKAMRQAGGLLEQ